MKNSSPFDLLAEEYDSWFDKDGRLIFETELLALKKVLQFLPKPWLEIGVGSGRFAQALGIEVGIDPSKRLLEIAKRRGVEVYQARGRINFLKRSLLEQYFLL